MTFMTYWQMVAVVFIMLGIYFYGTKLTLGATLSIIGCLMWFSIGIYAKLYPLAMLNAALAVLHSANIVKKWRK